MNNLFSNRKIKEIICLSMHDIGYSYCSTIYTQIESEMKRSNFCNTILTELKMKKGIPIFYYRHFVNIALLYSEAGLRLMLTSAYLNFNINRVFWELIWISVRHAYSFLYLQELQLFVQTKRITYKFVRPTNTLQYHCIQKYQMILNIGI